MKITGGKFNSRKVDAPDENISRPTLSKVRMGVFNALKSIINSYEGLNFLDLFGGSGIMGLEALSRGFEKVFVYEKNPKAAAIIKKNYENLGLKPDLRIGDSLKLSTMIGKKFDVVYIDPPYSSGIYEEVFEAIKPVLKPSSIVISESDTILNISDGYDLIKEKKYGDKIITFYSPKTIS